MATLVTEIDLAASAIAALSSEGITTLEQLEGYTREQLEAINGIGPVSAGQILDAIANIDSPQADRLEGAVRWAIATFEGLPLGNLGKNLADELRQRSGIQ